ncbi:anaerobic ribonucleoside-triphosphate reductase activating protein [Desulfofalx alkaliphila]|uniref:anaerobic ribonucleoside-triphosphate reductase activating protein n=1 Tax=Desulfofalx alkaliphila TaxID=105483 RepID=UPI0004E1DBEF|nr:anaerobic ribonucleoside-triphosphate reductase activating protein [Desulfofalx alkaliphila]
MIKARVAGITAGSVVDGLGIRTVVFFQGCPRQCPGCHNPTEIPFEGGQEIWVDRLAEKIMDKTTVLTKGITFSGGDPLAQPEALLETIKLIKQQKPQFDIWVYTGYTFEEVKHLPVIPLIDVLVDGPFIQEKRDLSLAFRGSSNQRLIDVVRTLETGEIVELAIDSEE